MNAEDVVSHVAGRRWSTSHSQATDMIVETDPIRMLDSLRCSSAARGCSHHQAA